jgi:predicted NUDIX family NTP pyrophosphohydrolase
VPRTSAGILLFRRTTALEVLIAHMGGPFWAAKDDRAWSIPKGEHDPDEDPLAAAKREFAEELGSPAPDVGYLDLGVVRQSGGKTVRAFAGEADFDVATVVSNTFEVEWPPRSGRVGRFPEVDRAAWSTIEVARDKLVAAQVVFLDRLVGVHR